MKSSVIFVVLLMLSIPFSSAASTVPIKRLFQPKGDGSEIPIAETGSTTTYFYAGSKLIASKNGEIKYHHQDRLGSDIESKTLPFGQEIYSGERFSFTGKELDNSGLYYFNARYYDSNLGKFTSVDPVKDNHAYSYVANNPMNLVDPTGSQQEDLFPIDIETIENNAFPGWPKQELRSHAAEVESLQRRLAQDVVLHEDPLALFAIIGLSIYKKFIVEPLSSPTSTGLIIAGAGTSRTPMGASRMRAPIPREGPNVVRANFPKDSSVSSAASGSVARTALTAEMDHYVYITAGQSEMKTVLSQGLPKGTTVMPYADALEGGYLTNQNYVNINIPKGSPLIRRIPGNGGRMEWTVLGGQTDIVDLSAHSITTPSPGGIGPEAISISDIIHFNPNVPID